MDCVFAGLREDRDGLVLRLRTLAAELDQLDRVIADHAWHGQGVPSALLTEHSERTARLRTLAAALRDLDERLSAY